MFFYLKDWKEISFWLVFLAFFIALVTFGWVGYLASDDFAYIDGALGWDREGFYVPINHWEVRHPLVLPLAMSIGLFGIEELSIILVSSLHFFVLIVLLYWWVKRHYSAVSAKFFILIIATMPMSSELIGTLNVDVIEAFWCIVSIILFLEAGYKLQRRNVLLLAAGISIGMAFLSRETSVGVLAGYGILFLLNKHVPRKSYFVMAIGFIAVVGIDLVIYFIVTGEPLYRFDVVFGSHSIPDQPTANFIQAPYLEPIGALLINNEFGLTFWLVAIAIYQLYGVMKSNKGYEPLYILGVIGVLHYLIVAYGLGLRALPRYYVVITIIASIFVAVFLARLWESGRVKQYWAISAFFLVALTNIILVDLSDQEPSLAESVFVSTVSEYPNQVVAADPRTCSRGLNYARLATNVPDYRTVEQCSDLSKADFVVYSSRNLQKMLGEEGEATPYMLESLTQHGDVLSFHYPEETYLGRLLWVVGINQVIDLPQRISRANEVIAVIRLH